MWPSCGGYKRAPSPRSHCAPPAPGRHSHERPPRRRSLPEAGSDGGEHAPAAMRRLRRGRKQRVSDSPLRFRASLDRCSSGPPSADVGLDAGEDGARGGWRRAVRAGLRASGAGTGRCVARRRGRGGTRKNARCHKCGRRAAPAACSTVPPSPAPGGGLDGIVPHRCREREREREREVSHLPSHTRLIQV